MVHEIIAMMCVASIIYLAIYACRKYATALDEEKRVEAREKRLKGLHQAPNFGYCHKVDLDNNKVIVGGKWIIDGYMQDVCFKEFPYNPDNAEDMAFAIREAEELIDKLKER